MTTARSWARTYARVCVAAVLWMAVLWWLTATFHRGGPPP